MEAQIGFAWRRWVRQAMVVTDLLRPAGGGPAVVVLLGRKMSTELRNEQGRSGRSRTTASRSCTGRSAENRSIPARSPEDTAVVLTMVGRETRVRRAEVLSLPLLQGER